MSKAKFAAAKELIQEKKYTDARGILKTIDHPTAQQWLTRLDEIDPPFPQIANYAPPPPSPLPPPPQPALYPQMMPPQHSMEEQRFYTRENRRASRRAISAGIQLVMGGVFMLVLFAYFMSTRTNVITGQTISLGFEAFLLPLGLISILGGLYRITRRNKI